MDRWEIREDFDGWSVYRNNRVIRYDLPTVDDALREVGRRVTDETTVTILNSYYERSKRSVRPR